MAFKYTLEKRQTKTGWRWRVVHQNGNIIANGGQAYNRLRDLNQSLGNMFRAVGPGGYNVVEIPLKKK